jgi:hypothetical protein
LALYVIKRCGWRREQHEKLVQGAECCGYAQQAEQRNASCGFEQLIRGKGHASPVRKFGLRPKAMEAAVPDSVSEQLCNIARSVDHSG